MKLDKRLLRLVKSSRLTLVVCILLGFTAGILMVAQARQVSRVISQVFLAGQGLEEVRFILLGLLGVILLRAMMVWGAEMAGSLAAQKVKTGLRQALFEHILSLGPVFARQERAGELVNTCLEGVDSLDAYFSQYLPQLLIAALVPLAFLLLIFPLDPLSAVILLVTAPLIPFFMVLIGSLAESLTKKQWEALSRISAYFYDVLQGLKTLKTFGRSRAQVEVLKQVSERYRRITMSVLRVTFLSALSLEMIATISTALVAVEIGLRLLYGRLTYEQALFVLLLAPEFYQPLRTLGARFHAGMAGVSAAARIFSILDEGKAECVNQSEALKQGRDETSGVRFDGVEYTYPDGSRALEGVSLTIPAGKTVALVGASGAGKSTLAAILLGFITPTRGDVVWDGQSLSNLSPEVWRQRVAWVPQQPYLFHDTVLANIRLARPEATLEEIVAASQRAHAHEFILNLPQGYDTVIGERGARLSAGQAQRIALARAFLKDAPLLVLDEATSNLDPEQETLIQAAIHDLMQGRTTLVIAHRLNTVYRADVIYVMQSGRIVEAGKHEELIRAGGLYRLSRETYAAGEGHDGSSREPMAVEAPPPEEVIVTRRPDTSIQTASEPEPKISSWRALWRLLALVSPHWNSILLSVLFGFLTVGSGIGLMATSAYIITAAALQPSIAVLQVPIVGVRFFGISRGVFRYLERYTSHQTTFMVLSRLWVWFYQGLEPLAPARLIAYKGGDLLSRVIGDIASLENFYVRGLAPPLVAIAVAGVSFLYLVSFSPRLGVNLLVFLLLAGVGAPLLGMWASRGAGRRLVQARSELSASLVDGILGMADLLAFGQERRQTSLVHALNQRASGLQTRMAGIGALQTASLTLLAHLALWVSLMIAIPLVRSGEIQGVYLAVVALATLTSFEAVTPLPLAAQYLEANLEAARRLFEISDAPPLIPAPAQPLPAPGEDARLSIAHLSFRYPISSGADAEINPVYALQDLSLDLPRGKRMALVGPSGAGKTTLVNVLLRYWDYQEGLIELDGGEIRRYDPEEVRNWMGVVEQNAYLFNTTIRENLLIARPDASVEDIVRACRIAQIYDFIQSLPMGFETQVGEGGMRLSGGERQRLAIARALLRRAPLLILDEPTANLDSLVEREVLEAIIHQDRRTILLITHRLTEMEQMDEILVLNQGRVVERGQHHELLRANGLYRRMWDLQRQILA